MITLARVAQLIVHHPDGRRRGSGYLITTTAVLTAAHVLEDAESVEIRFPSESTVTAVSWEVGESDIAVVTIPAKSEVEPAKFGSVGARPAILEVQAVGFPRWKMRNDDGTTFVDGDVRPAQRDSYHLRGTAAVLSNIREGTLEIEIQSAPGVADPWEGMSGAALWVRDRIIGVITAHHPSEGATRLTAVRAQGVTPIPQDSPDLTQPVHRLTCAYQAQLADIAPEVLNDRAEEMASLTRFCLGDAPYGWWQAGPWAGKTALLSSFALSPPTGVDVVSFFITNRFAGQSDSTAFTDALLEQLGALAREPVRELRQSRSPHREVLRLLKEIAAERRLVLVVDGLDEDTSTAMGLPSVAALLPARRVPGLRVLIASRPHPRLPDDVPADHLLRSTKIWQLRVYSNAQVTETTARDELMRSLMGSPFQQQILGLITAAGGGLTVGDLAELTGEPPYKVRPLLGRNLSARRSAHSLDEPVYLYAHETLRVTAEQEFGGELVGYRDELHRWADRYRQAGWPSTTPLYLIRSYSRLLAQHQDIPRMLAFAVDHSRHNWLLDHTGGDALAFAEIAAVARLLVDQPEPDFVALVRLALARDLLEDRHAAMPFDLPAAWVALGRPERGIALAEAMPYGAVRTEAFNRLVRALAKKGHLQEAIGLASGIVSMLGRSYALASVVVGLLTGVNTGRAERVAWEIPDSKVRDQALTWIAAVADGSASVPVGDVVDLDIPVTPESLDQAEKAVRAIADPYERLRSMSRLAAAMPPERGVRMAIETEVAARAIASPDGSSRQLGDLVEALVAVRSLHTAGEVALTIPRRSIQMLSVLRVMRGHEQAGESRKARALARELAARNGVKRILAPSRDPDDSLLYFAAYPARREVRKIEATDLHGLAEALCTWDWSIVLPGVARWAPETLHVIREALLGQHPD